MGVLFFAVWVSLSPQGGGGISLSPITLFTYIYYLIVLPDIGKLIFEVNYVTSRATV
jgi:hypothetical protein